MADGSALQRPTLPHPAADPDAWSETIASLKIALTLDRRETREAIRRALHDFESELAAQRRRHLRIVEMVEAGQASAAAAFTMEHRVAQLRGRIDELRALMLAPARGKPRTIAPVPAVRFDARADVVRQRIRDAVWVLRHTKLSIHSFPARMRTSMPEPVRDFWETYNSTDAPKITRQQPTAEQISACDATLPWFFWIDNVTERSALWLRHIPLSWRRVGQRLGKSHVWAVQAEARAVDQIVCRLGKCQALERRAS